MQKLREGWQTYLGSRGCLNIHGEKRAALQGVCGVEHVSREMVPQPNFKVNSCPKFVHAALTIQHQALK